MPPRGGAAASRPARGGGALQSPAPEAPMHAQTAEASAPAASRSGTPAAGASRGSSARAGSSAGSKFRPRGNRRTEAERDRIAEEQQRIQDKRLADDARQRSRGRFRRAGRARGGLRERDPRFASASGPLSHGMAEGVKAGPGRGGFSGGGMGGGFRGKAGVARESVSKYSFADGVEDNNRINADELRGRGGDSDEEEQKGGRISSTQKRRPILPVGIRREEHEEKGVEVATAADLEAEEKGLLKTESESDSEEMWVEGPETEEGQGAELEGDEGVWQHAAPKAQSKVKIKTEDGQMIETMDIDEIAAHAQPKQPDSPEVKKSIAIPESASDKRLRKRKAATKDPEEEAFSEELEQLLDLLTIDSRSREEAGSDAAGPNSLLEGHMFLFQFPPVLPPLTRSTAPVAKGRVKDEPTDDVIMPGRPGQDPANIDLTAEETGGVVKTEEGSEEEEPNGTGDAYTEGGYVGQLVVRKSGKVELSWGGQTLELVSGMTTQFLTSAVLLEEGEANPKAGQTAGTAFGMGKVEGKFVLAPRWGEEEEWEVDPDELAAE